MVEPCREWHKGSSSRGHTYAQAAPVASLQDHSQIPRQSKNYARHVRMYTRARRLSPFPLPGVLSPCEPARILNASFFFKTRIGKRIGQCQHDGNGKKFDRNLQHSNAGDMTPRAAAVLLLTVGHSRQATHSPREAESRHTQEQLCRLLLVKHGKRGRDVDGGRMGERL